MPLLKHGTKLCDVPPDHRGISWAEYELIRWTELRREARIARGRRTVRWLVTRKWTVRVVTDDTDTIVEIADAMKRFRERKFADLVRFAGKQVIAIEGPR